MESSSSNIDPLSCILTLLFQFNFSLNSLIGVFFILLLLCLAAIVSALEVAFFSLDSQDWEQLENESTEKQFKIFKDWQLHPKKLLATLLVSISFFNIANIILMENVLHEMFHFDNPLANLIFKLIIEAILILLFAEIMPIIYANYNSTWVVKTFYKIAQICESFFKPVTWLMNTAIYTIEKPLKKYAKESLSLEEIDHAIDLTTEDNNTNSREINMLKGIVKFGNIAAAEIMKPRLDVVSINAEADFSEVLNTIKQSGYSRLPVYTDDLDNIQGVLYSKDLIAHLHKTNDFNWKSLLREPLYVSESKMIDDLLNTFKNKRMHFGVVINEYGGTEGIVTLEDVLEVVIGDIRDEFDEEQTQNIKKLNDKNYIVEGKTTINEFCKYFDISRDYFIQSEEVDTLGGLLIEWMKRIPQAKETYTFKAFYFEIDLVTKNRIQKIKVQVSENFSE